MANNVPLYTASREYARTHDELPLWRESLNENIRCNGPSRTPSDRASTACTLNRIAPRALYKSSASTE